MNKSRDHELDSEMFAPIRQRVDIQVGKFVMCNNKAYRIHQVLDFESVIGIDVETGLSAPLLVGELRPVTEELPPRSKVNVDLEAIGDEDWKIAERRYAIIKPLLNLTSRSDVDKRAKETGVDASTLYRWIKQYKAYGSASALVPKKRGWAEGKGRIPARAEKIINDVIENYYLTPQRPTAQKAVTEVLRKCYKSGIEAPGANAIRRRLSRIPEKTKLRGRGFREKAHNKFFPVPGSFPKADFPLEHVQIDHTPSDIILVDDLYRKPIGRPWITMAIDIYSRMITGYYLSFDAPSETSVAMCVAHSIIPKDEWLLLQKVDSTWPVWGIPKTIHVDNGGDFRSSNFQRSCLNYAINLEFRPVKQPRYGGHIERLLGTMLTEIHALPGTTFSSIKDREGYNAEKQATMTKSEFESWLVTLICKLYHQRLHTNLGMTPLRKWNIGIFGNSEVNGIGLPPKPADRHTVLLDFLPSFFRTVQAFGVTIDDMTYYAEALRPWINANDPATGKKRQLVFRRDPRDISAVFFFDPDLKMYFKVPFADQSLPVMSIWEYRQAKKKLKQEGAASVNNHQLMETITELRSLVDETKENTKKARRQAQRRKEHEKKVSPASPLPAQQKKPEPVPSNSSMSDMVDEDLEPVGDIS